MKPLKPLKSALGIPLGAAPDAAVKNLVPKIYVASSWNNPDHHHVITALRSDGFEPFDFKQTNSAFNWRTLAPGWPNWDLELFKRALRSAPAERAFKNDMVGLDEADGGVLLLDAGISAHTEFGYLVGQGKPVFILYPHDTTKVRAELMYKMASGIFQSNHDLVAALCDLWPDTRASKEPS